VQHLLISDKFPRKTVDLEPVLLHNTSMISKQEMSMFVVYNKKTTLVVGSDRHNAWKSLGAAKAHLTRMGKMGYRVSDFAIASNEDFSKVEKQVEKVNLMTGKKFMQSVNTPRACDPSSELYWSM